MDETEEIEELVVSNNLLATLGRLQLHPNYSTELLSWYTSNVIVFTFIQDLWNYRSQLSYAIERPILTALWLFPQGNFDALGTRIYF